MHSNEGTGGPGKAEQLTRSAREAAGEVASTAGEQARSLAGEARSEAAHVAEDVQSRLREEAREQTRRTSQNLREWSDELSSMADQGSPGSPVGDVVRQVAQGGQSAADFLDERGIEGLVEETKEFARRRPVAFLAGAVLAGFVVGRAIKASSAVSDQTGNGQPEALGPDERTPMPRQGDTATDDVAARFHRPEMSRPEASGYESPGYGTPLSNDPTPPPADPGTPGRPY
ncbi:MULTISPECIES: hypothetical protein [unclassified Nocardiopsis]|uniref:hypothetical protein n=1 Tax=unclassified Nocardiopsis TaxID=2649073 RepID=UPI0019151B62|nr:MULTISPECIES: hypothetical protein [unclassified Nocardiopsis]